MTALNQIRDAMIGWYDLALHRPGWRERFVATPEGLLVALGAYFAAVVIAILVQGIVFGAPGIVEFVTALAVNALPLAGVSLALYTTRMALFNKTPFLAMLVPAIHAVTILLIAGFLLSIIGSAMALVLLALLGYLLYRGGREILGLGFAFALSYAGLSIVLLVVLPASLYMLLAPGPGGPI